MWMHTYNLQVYANEAVRQSLSTSVGTSHFFQSTTALDGYPVYQSKLKDYISKGIPRKKWVFVNL